MKFLNPANNQKGALHLLLLLGIVGILGLSVVTSYAPLKAGVFSVLFNKGSIFASVPQDLDVTYISQSPKYNRYCVNFDNNIPKLCPGTENQKRYPDVGEEITYTAHVKNKGTQPSGNFNYSWKVDGVEASSSAFIGSLQPEGEMTAELKLLWKQENRIIEFGVNPPPSQDGFAQNNGLKIGTRDLTISYWVEKDLYDMFNQAQNFVGTYSFEDWIQGHIAKMNERFAQAKYPSSPDGIKDRVRIEKIVIADQLDGNGCPSLLKDDPDLYLIDGRWQSTDGTCDNSAGRNGGYSNYFNQYINNIDWGLNHEITHQLGVIDLYRMNVKNNEPSSPNGGVQVLNLNLETIPYSDLNFPVFKNSGLMGGGEIAPYTEGNYYESHTAVGLNENYGKRRGFYGDYLYNTPDNNSIKIVDKNGTPLTNATVALYQKDASSEDIDNTPEQQGVTDNQGILTLNNRPVQGFTSPTGQVLKPNPFGQISNVGTNGLMIVKVTKDEKEGYGFYRLHDVNLQYYLGNKTNSLVEISTNYPKASVSLPVQVPDGTNIALNKSTSASSTITANGWSKENVVDGKTSSSVSSMGWTSNDNLGVNHEEWIQVNLGAIYGVGGVNLYPRTDYPGRFFPKDFKIQVSLDGVTFTDVASYTNYVNPGAVVQKITFNPVKARIVRVLGSNLMFEENTYRMQFAEIEILSATIAIPTPTPTATPTPTPSPTPKPKAVFGDFDGDGKADVAVFRPSDSSRTSRWYINRPGFDILGYDFGKRGDIPVIGDYDGDGKMNKALYRTSNSTWYVDNENAAGTVRGESGDLPVPGDYNGDGKTEKAVYRVKTGVWETTVGNISWGRPNSKSVAVPADYNGDGKVEPGWFDPVNDQWFIQTNPSVVEKWGSRGNDVAVPADYNGDKKADIAYFADGKWFIKLSGFLTTGISWGQSGDVPVPAEYAGQGRAQLAVFRPGNGSWYINSDSSSSTIAWGVVGDIPTTKRPSVSSSLTSY